MLIRNPDGEIDSQSPEQERGRTTESLHIPKNRSTGNLLAQSSRTVDKSGRVRFSFDAAGLTGAEYDALSRSVISEFQKPGIDQKLWASQSQK